jgi:uncharacterized membrane protein YjfL (UPF0719 family)
VSSAAPAPAPPRDDEHPAAEALPIHPALALGRAGTVAGACLVLAGAIAGSGRGERLVADLPWMAAFATAGLGLAAIGAALLDRAYLPGGMAPELGRGNLAAGLTAAAHRVACGVIAWHCLFGADLTGLAVGAAFFVLGVVTLLAFQVLHRKLTRYADDQEIRGGNVAAALSNAGLGVALAIIVGHAADGSFTSWSDSLVSYGLALALAVALYPVRQVLVKRLILGLPLSLRGHRLDQEIAERRNPVVGAVEGLTYLAVALLVTGIG